MTRTLVLMRHAKSLWEDPTLADHDRPLNSRGMAAAQTMGDWLRNGSYVPDHCVSSSSTRTRQTFVGLRLDVPADYMHALYHVDAENMLGVLQQQEAPTVLMLGHNPGIADFARLLVDTPPRHLQFRDYPTCATAVIWFDIAVWPDVHWRSGLLVDFAIPREVQAGQYTRPGRR